MRAYLALLMAALVALACVPANPVAELERTAERQQQGFEAAFAESLKRAKAGDVESMSVVGQMYQTGQGTWVNHAEAQRWYRTAAEKGACGVGVPARCARRLRRR
ncbi:MAG: sel1 repeat family protein [Deltaproteobacteria bacterium]|nr:sel1 repeat family protein [Deltaproteobacteria bacterium]